MTTTTLSRHWQLAPDDGGTVRDEADIGQCILNILATRKGEDVCRPDFGSAHHDYTDTPEDVLVPNMVREVMLAVQTWEPRAVLEHIAFDGRAPHLLMTLHWRVAGAAAGEIRQTALAVKAA